MISDEHQHLAHRRRGAQLEERVEPADQKRGHDRARQPPTPPSTTTMNASTM